MKILKTTLIIMGFSVNLFAQPKVDISDQQENWASYFSYIDDQLCLISTDLNLSKKAPIKDQQTFTYVIIKMNAPNEDGLSSQEESKVLWQIEDSIISALNNSTVDFTMAGRLSANGYRDIYFYSDDKVITETLLIQTMIEFQGYTFNIGSKDDPAWESYFKFLYPIPQQLQSIENQRVLKGMYEAGDDLSKEREVVHWIYFKTDSKLRSFEKYALRKGFKTIKRFKNSGKPNYDFLIQISRVDKVGYDDIDDYTIDLWEKANKLDGVYDGWETSLMN